MVRQSSWVSVLVQIVIHLCSFTYSIGQTTNIGLVAINLSIGKTYRYIQIYVLAKTKVSAFFINQITIQKSLPIEVGC